MQDVNADRRLLLGTLGWERDDWLRDYYPEDLPPEWRLAYYANACDCVMLAADRWVGAPHETLEESLDELGGRLRFFLARPARWAPWSRANLALFDASQVVLLVDRPDPAEDTFPQWVAQGPGCWVDADGNSGLQRWAVDSADLRVLRASAERMPSTTAALVLDGPAASPGLIPRLRTLLELLGRA